MRKLLLTLSYLGTSYHGWQVQRGGGSSVQQILQDAVEAVYGARYDVTGCSRTDAGVHALMFCATLGLPDEAPNIPPSRVPDALNRFLPRDVSVYGCVEVGESFHARYSVKSKTYEYRIDTSGRRDPFTFGRAWQYGRPLDVERMNEAAGFIVGRRDFSAFMASGSSVSDTVRTVFECFASRGARNENIVSIVISADGFLYNMVRIIAGTLVSVSCGRLEPGDIPALIESRDRSQAGMTAPPEGLYLARVDY